MPPFNGGRIPVCILLFVHYVPMNWFLWIAFKSDSADGWKDRYTIRLLELSVDNEVADFQMQMFLSKKTKELSPVCVNVLFINYKALENNTKSYDLRKSILIGWIGPKHNHMRLIQQGDWLRGLLARILNHKLHLLRSIVVWKSGGEVLRLQHRRILFEGEEIFIFTASFCSLIGSDSNGQKSKSC